MGCWDWSLGMNCEFLGLVKLGLVILGMILGLEFGALGVGRWG